MATTTNFGWDTPDDTDLVKDGAAAIRTALNGVDTSFVDLKGGTTGQVLAKASATDLDFVWSADAAGMTNPMTTTGDVIYSSSGSTPARLGVGSTGDILTVAGGVPTWAAPGGGKIAQVVYGSTSTLVANATSTYADSGLTATITPTSATSTILVLTTNDIEKSATNANNGAKLQLLRGASVVSAWGTYLLATFTALRLHGSASFNYLDSPATTSATTYKIQFANNFNGDGIVYSNGGTSSIVLMEVLA